MAKVQIRRSNWNIDPVEMAVAQERTAARLADLLVHRQLAGHPSPRPAIIVDGVELIGSPDEPQLDDRAPLGSELVLPVEATLAHEPSVPAEAPLAAVPVLSAEAPLLQETQVVIDPAHTAGRLIGRAGGALARPSTGPAEPVELVGVFGPPAEPVGAFESSAAEPVELVGVFDPLASEPVRVMAFSASAMAFPERGPQRDDAAPASLQLALDGAVDTSSPHEAEIAAPVGGLSSASAALVDGPVEAEPAFAEVEAVIEAEPPIVEDRPTLAEVQSVTEDGPATEVQPRVGFEPDPLDKPEATPSATAGPEPNPSAAAEPAADVLSRSEALLPSEPQVDSPAGSELVPPGVTLRKPRLTKVAVAAKVTAPHANAAPVKVTAPTPKASAKATASNVADPAAEAVPPARPTAGAAPVPRSAGAAPPRAAPALAAAVCPYCARVLQPPPGANRHCPRCRQLIVVKRVEGHVAYLTEAAVAIFEAERRKELDSGRWNQERERWLKLAAAAGAPTRSTRIIAAARISEEVVEAARTLFMTTAERAFESAKRQHRWEDAARVRRDQASALHRVAGSPKPPTVDVVTLYREGLTAELRGLAEIVREAELVADDCCERCRVNDRRIVVISEELAAPSLPHQGCPRGLCRCSWDLATRDREAMLRYLRRRPRPAAHVASAKHPANR